MHELPHIMPFLWVHGEDEATYRKMVGVIYDADLRAFCVEARPHEGFVQDAWWHDMDILLDEAEKRGMKVWILDDKHFPTGFAAGEALKARLELRRQNLLHKVFPVRGGRIKLDLKKKAHPPVSTDMMYYVNDIIHKNRTAENKFSDDAWYSVAAVRTDAAAEPIDLGPYVKGDVLQWDAPAGQWQVHLCYLSRNCGTHRSYINMMDAESCRIQIDAVYEPHYAHYKDKFGTVIAGFFSDEPELGNNRMYRMENVLGTEQELPWSRELDAALRERLGGELPRLLPLLWCDGGNTKTAAKMRYAFMDCVSRLVERDFSRQIGEWCRERGVEYIGHVVEDNNQHARTGTSLGHYFRGLKWQTMAGIDDIGGQVEPGCEDRRKKNVFGYEDDGEFYHYALGKLGSSLASVNPRMQGCAMCEIFGNYGWKEGVRLEKYLLDHFMVRGINYFVPHAFTCSAYPEKDCPPHFYAQGNNPQYRHFGALMAYANRVTGLLSHAQAAAPVAVLYHGEAEWCGKAMLSQKPARVLTDHQIDFNFIPADVFSEPDFYCTGLGSKLTVNGHTYTALVIPYAQFITRETADAIETLAANGCKVLFLDALPDGLCTGEDLPAVLHRCTVTTLDDLAPQFERTLGIHPSNDRLRVTHFVGQTAGQQDFYYLFNEGDKAWTGDIALLGESPYHLYDAWHDRHMAWNGPLTLAPAQSIFLMAGPAPEDAWQPAPRGEKLLLTKCRQSTCRAVDYPQFGSPRMIAKLENYALTDKKFSGYIRYEATFKHPAQTLEITDAYEGVEVFLNGESLGIQVVPPFTYDLRGKVRDGENKLAVEVATTLERENNKGKNGAPTGITGEIALYL